MIYLGKVVGQGEVRPVRAKVMAIDNFLPTSTKKELMQFLGMVGYYQSFCSNFSTVVAPSSQHFSSVACNIWTDIHVTFCLLTFILTCTTLLFIVLII